MDRTKERILSILEQVNDPEIPVLNVLELGIVRDVIVAGEDVEVVITPTYSGCPAMEVIRSEISAKLAKAGFTNSTLRTVLSPAWTTDWISTSGRDKLKAYGIAPPHPVPVVCDIQAFHREEAVQCPLCNSFHTRLISQFGSTPCKALYQCNDCMEPFEYFKCH
jgi:ring-1,2-phenylacetyl-CoA epoxidase subunit PaaD